MTPEEVKTLLREKTKAYHEVFTASTGGKKILADLRANFNEVECARLGDTDHDTVVRSAKRDVIDYIDQMIRVGGQKDD